MDTYSQRFTYTSFVCARKKSTRCCSASVWKRMLWPPTSLDVQLHGRTYNLKVEASDIKGGGVLGQLID